MSQTIEEKRAYARGYHAGRTKTAAEQEKWDRVHAEIHGKDMDRRDAFFCAALTGMLANQNWRIGEKPMDADQYVDLAKKIADKATQKMPRFGL